jgi:hypothetical protein
MHERKVLNDNEWFGWVQRMRICFRLGTIKEHWKQIHLIGGYQQILFHKPRIQDDEHVRHPLLP